MDKTMTLAQAIDSLAAQFKGKEWFFEVDADQYGRPVVYVHFHNYATLHDIPDYVGGHQVLVHFAASKTAKRDQFVENQNKPKLPEYKPLPVEAADNLPFELTNGIVDVTDDAELVEDKSVQYLVSELTKLEKQVGSNILQDIFYETHDGRNAVTQLSAKFPEAAAKMQKLYKMYGFDVIYEELDG